MQNHHNKVLYCTPTLWVVAAASLKQALLCALLGKANKVRIVYLLHVYFLITCNVAVCLTPEDGLSLEAN